MHTHRSERTTIILAAALGAAGGITIFAWLTRAIPKMMTQMMQGMMQSMRAQMQTQGCSPADI